MRELLRRLTSALESGLPVLLCRVVASRGSTPQKAGASMLLHPDGGQVGTLGGGCVEAAVKQRAASLVGQAGAEVFSYLLDHDPEWADGLICGGRMVVMAECPAGSSHLAYYSAYRRLLEGGRGFTEAIAIDRGRSGLAVGERFLFDRDATPFASLSGSLPSPRASRGASSRSPLDLGSLPKKAAWPTCRRCPESAW